MRSRTFVSLSLTIVLCARSAGQYGQADATSNHNSDVLVFAVPADVQIVSGPDGDAAKFTGRIPCRSDAFSLRG